MNKILLIPIFFMFSVLLISYADAAAFIKYDGIDGESKDPNHQGWSDIQSFNQAIHKPGGGATGQSRRRGSVVFEDVILTKELDKSSPKIQEAIAKGEVIPSVMIHVTKSVGEGRETYYAYELKNVLVTSYSVSGDADDVPTEEVSLNFEEIKVTYTEFDRFGSPMGLIEFLWSLVRGR